MHLVGFIIRIYHDGRSPERQISFNYVVFVMQMQSVHSAVRNDILYHRNELQDYSDPHDFQFAFSYSKP